MEGDTGSAGAWGAASLTAVAGPPPVATTQSRLAFRIRPIGLVGVIVRQGCYALRVTNGADAIDLDAMAHDLVLSGVSDMRYDGFDVGEANVFRSPAGDANQVMVVRLIAEAVTDRAIAQDDATDEAAIEQQLDRAVDSGAPDGDKLRRQLFGGEVVVAGGDVFDNLIAGRGDLEALVAQLVGEALGRGLGCHAAIIAPLLSPIWEGLSQVPCSVRLGCP